MTIITETRPTEIGTNCCCNVPPTNVVPTCERFTPAGHCSACVQMYQWWQFSLVPGLGGTYLGLACYGINPVFGFTQEFWNFIGKPSGLNGRCQWTFNNLCPQFNACQVFYIGSAILLHETIQGVDGFSLKFPASVIQNPNQTPAAVYRLPMSAWNCLGPNVMPLISVTGCTGWPATITLQPMLLPTSVLTSYTVTIPSVGSSPPTGSTCRQTISLGNTNIPGQTTCADGAGQQVTMNKLATSGAFVGASYSGWERWLMGLPAGVNTIIPCFYWSGQTLYFGTGGLGLSKYVAAVMYVPAYTIDRVFLIIGFITQTITEPTGPGSSIIVVCSDSAMYESPLGAWNPFGGTNFTLRYNFMNGCVNAPSSIQVGQGGG